MTATSWLRVDLTYTARNQLDTIARSADSGVPGPLTSWTTTYGYDATGRITGIANTVNGALGDSFFYSYDAAGRLTAEQSGGATQVFSYDSADQLTSEARSGTSPRSYSYDANGNRTNTGYVTGPGNRLLSDGVWSYEYDAEGNRVKKTKGASQETWTYGYDLDNRLVWVEKRASDGGTLQLRVDYTYDAFGNRVQTRASPGGLERYAYDDRDLWADLDSSGSVQYRYLRGDVVDQVFARQAATGGGLWYETDRLGSVRKIISTGGQTLGVRDYDGYGNALSAAYSFWVGRYGWAGREYDAATGLYYNRARYYDPATGRFTSEDPLGLAPDANPFRYVGNSPTNATDPSGLWELWWPGRYIGRYLQERWKNQDFQDELDELRQIRAQQQNAADALIEKLNRFQDKVHLEAGHVERHGGYDANQIGPRGLRELERMGTCVATTFVQIGVTRVEGKLLSWLLSKGWRVVKVLRRGKEVERLVKDGRKLAEKELEALQREFDQACKKTAPNKVPTNPLVARIQGKLNLYPQVIDPRTGRNIPFPSGIKEPVNKGLRVAWDSKADRAAFIAEWHRRGYAPPRGGWDKYDIHHIQPREFGGTNDFWNLVPVERNTHQNWFNEFWREFTEL